MINGIQGRYTVLELPGQDRPPIFLFFFSPEDSISQRAEVLLKADGWNKTKERELTKSCWIIFLTELKQTGIDVFFKDQQSQLGSIIAQMNKPEPLEWNEFYDLKLLAPFASTSQSADKTRSVLLGISFRDFMQHSDKSWPIGVDVESRNRIVSNSIKEYFLSADEQQIFKGEELKAWVIKEAAYKFFYKYNRQQLPEKKITNIGVKKKEQSNDIYETFHINNLDHKDSSGVLSNYAVIILNLDHKYWISFVII